MQVRKDCTFFNALVRDPQVPLWAQYLHVSMTGRTVRGIIEAALYKSYTQACGTSSPGSAVGNRRKEHCCVHVGKGHASGMGFAVAETSRDEPAKT